MNNRFPPTPSQQVAIDTVVNSVDNPLAARKYVLRGYAGTGKTVTASNIIFDVLSKGLKVQIAAPTAAALAVLKNKLGEHEGLYYNTLASLLQRPVSVLKLNDDMQFKMNARGILESSIVLERLGIKSDDLYDSTFKGRTTPINVKSLSPNDSIRGEPMLDFETLQNRVKERFGGKSPFDLKYDAEFEIKDPGETYGAHLNNPVRGRVSLVVVDEYSMVNEDLSKALCDAIDYDDAMTLLVCGDGGQLQPVEGVRNEMITAEANGETVFELTEILRSDDKIAKFAQTIRSGHDLKTIAALGHPQIVSVQDRDINAVYSDPEAHELFADSDVVVTFMNKNVDAINNLVRADRGFEGSPQAGEKLVCNQNSRGLYDFVNGELLTVKKVLDKDDLKYETQEIRALISGEAADAIHLDVAIEEGRILALELENSMGEIKRAFIWSTLRARRDKISTMIDRVIKHSGNLPPLIPVSFAYALTVHKAQGSEWDSVVYLTSPRDLAIQKTWHAPYTAITRAKHDVNVVMMRS